MPGAETANGLPTRGLQTHAERPNRIDSWDSSIHSGCAYFLASPGILVNPQAKLQGCQFPLVLLLTSDVFILLWPRMFSPSAGRTVNHTVAFQLPSALGRTDPQSSHTSWNLLLLWPVLNCNDLLMCLPIPLTCELLEGMNYFIHRTPLVENWQLKILYKYLLNG